MGPVASAVVVVVSEHGVVMMALIRWQGMHLPACPRAVVVSEHGNVLAELELPEAPIQPLVVADFNGDGLNDLVAVTAQGVYGYVQVRARMQCIGGTCVVLCIQCTDTCRCARMCST